MRITIANSRRLQAQYDELGIAASAIADATVLSPTEVALELKRTPDGDEIEIDAMHDVLNLIQIPQRRNAA